MSILHSHESAKGSNARLTILVVALAMSFAFGFLFGSDYGRSRTSLNLSYPLISVRARNQTVITNTTFEGYNSTHLWSMRLADENYVRLARLLPCRNVTYGGGPKNDSIDSCDHSTTSEFSVETSVRAQMWLFEHQNPANCSNKRFAMIQQFAWSGFGSTVHQIVWAFGMAIADDRIAIYKAPGNWVSDGDQDLSKSLLLSFRSIPIARRPPRSAFSSH